MLSILFTLLWALRKPLKLAYSFGTMEPSGEHIMFPWFIIERSYEGKVSFRLEDPIVAATFPLVIWFMEECPFPSYADRGAVIPAPWWEAWVAYLDNERVVVRVELDGECPGIESLEREPDWDRYEQFRSGSL